MSHSIAFAFIRNAEVKTEARLRLLSSSPSVQKALAQAEVEFRAKEVEGRWHEDAGSQAVVAAPGSSNGISPPWQAGVAYAKAVALAYSEAALDQIERPAEFESLVRGCVRLMAERTYHQKLQPYDRTPARALGLAIARFRQLVESALAPEVARLNFEAWRRYRCRLEGVVPKSLEGARLEPQAGSDREDHAPEAADAGEAREARLQAFLAARHATIAQVRRAARVNKPDMQRWRRGELKKTSSMAQRIEAVLAGREPLSSG